LCSTLLRIESGRILASGARTAFMPTRRASAHRGRARPRPRAARYGRFVGRSAARVAGQDSMGMARRRAGLDAPASVAVDRSVVAPTRRAAPRRAADPRCSSGSTPRNDSPLRIPGVRSRSSATEVHQRLADPIAAWSLADCDPTLTRGMRHALWTGDTKDDSPWLSSGGVDDGPQKDPIAASLRCAASGQRKLLEESRIAGPADTCVRSLGQRVHRPATAPGRLSTLYRSRGLLLRATRPVRRAALRQQLCAITGSGHVHRVLD
jgi:hypothetical protein